MKPQVRRISGAVSSVLIWFIHGKHFHFQSVRECSHPAVLAEGFLGDINFYDFCEQEIGIENLTFSNYISTLSPTRTIFMFHFLNMRKCKKRHLYYR